MKILIWLLLISLWFLAGCSYSQESSTKLKETFKSKKATTISWLNNLTTQTTVNNKTSLSNNSKNIIKDIWLNSLAKTWTSIKKENNDTLNKEELMRKKEQEKIIKFEKEEKEKIKNLDFSMCNWLKWWLKENCYMRIIFSKYNKQGCDLIKTKDINLYKKCLEIKKWIETWKKIRKYKYYYEEYWQDNY